MTEKVEFTRIQRTILANQFKIMEKLGIESGMVDGGYKEGIEILERGFKHDYSRVLVPSEEIPEKVSDEVISILDLYNSLASLCGNNEDSTKDIAEKINKFGFDANSEEGHYYYAKWMIKDNHRYLNLEKYIDNNNLDLNSHGDENIEQMLKYANRYKKFFQESNDTFDLEVARKILDL